MDLSPLSHIQKAADSCIVDWLLDTQTTKPSSTPLDMKSLSWMMTSQKAEATDVGIV